MFFFFLYRDCKMSTKWVGVASEACKTAVYVAVICPCNTLAGGSVLLISNPSLSEEEEEERVKIRREKVSSPRHTAMPWHSSCPVLKLSLLVSGAMRQAILAPWCESIPNHITFAGSTST